MIVLVLILIEIGKAILIGIPVGFFIYLILRAILKTPIWKSWGTFRVIAFLSVITAFAWPFFELKTRFEHWASAEEELCEKYVDYQVVNDLPRDLVAVYGSDKSQYSRGESSYSGWHNRLTFWNIHSFAVYDPSPEENRVPGKPPLDGIEGRWKKLWLDNEGSTQCDHFQKHAKRDAFGYGKFVKALNANNISNKCVAIEVIEDESAINFIAKETKPNLTLYRDKGFSTSLSETRIHNERSNKIYVVLKKLESGWPRFPNNFHALFVAKAGSCEAQRNLIRKKISSTNLEKDVFYKLY